MERKGLDISSYQKGIKFDEIKAKVEETKEPKKEEN